MNKYTLGDAITSLVYASGINVIFSRCINDGYYTLIGGLIISLFIFLDWLSRIGLLLNVDDDDDQKRRKTNWVILLKSTFEIAAIYFLISTTINLLLTPRDTNNSIAIDPIITFGLFVLISFLWNSLTLYILTKLDFRELYQSIWQGNVFDLEAIGIYIKGFKSKTVLMAKQLNHQGSLKNANKLKNRILYECFARTFTQLIANHISWINLFIAIILLTNIEHDYLNSIMLKHIDNIIVIRVIILFMLIFLPTVLYYFPRKKDVEKHMDNESKSQAKVSDNSSEEITQSRIFKIFMMISAIMIVLLFIIFYISFSNESLIYVMLFQHAISGLFLQFSTHLKNKNKSTNNSCDPLKTKIA